MTGPYGQAALTYYSRGWTDVFPVGSDTDPLAKSPVPVGVTGYEAGPVGWERIKRGTLTRAAIRNLGVRMPRQVIALDVDEYDGHEGGATLKAAEAYLGDLPATYRNTARGTGDAGHRFYRTGMGRVAIPGAEEILAKAYGPNIDILHYGRRYAVVWPSLNPSADLAPYRWYSPAGDVLDGPPPRVIDLPVLPAAWQQLLTAPVGSPAATWSGGGSRRSRAAADGVTEADDGLWDSAGDLIRRTLAEIRTAEQIQAVLTMRIGSVNKTLGGAGIWLARMANAGLITLDQGRDLIFAAAAANGVHSDAWNQANRRRWTLASRVADAMSQGLNRTAFTIIDDAPPTDVYGQLIKRTGRA